MRAVLHATTPLLGPGAGRRADGVGHQPRAAGHRPRRADLRHAPRRPRVGRPIGGSGALTEALRAAFEHHGGELRTGSAGRRRSSATATRVRRRRRSTDGTEITAAGRRLGVRPAAHVRRAGCATRPPGAAAMVARWRPTPRRPRATSRRSTPSLDREPRLRDSDARPGVDAARSPRRSPRWTGRRRCWPPAAVLDRRRCSSTCRRCRPDDGARTAATCSASRCCSRRTACRAAGPARPSRGAGSSCSPSCCEPGFLDSIVDWRAMTPDVYERDFHLPARPRHQLRRRPAGRAAQHAIPS